MSVELVVFDFDGTLAHRPGMWSQCLLDVLDSHLPGHGVMIDDLRVHLRDGFPWHHPETPHPQIRSADHWWRVLGELIGNAYLAVGVAPDELDAPRAGVRSHYCDPAQFQLYPDVPRALQELRAAAVPVVILSNHVPELETITAQLGLDSYIDQVFTSAVIGYEKPHAEAFGIARRDTDPSTVWMIGDSPIADKRGAEDAGMHGVLVRHVDGDHTNVLTAVQSILLSR